MSHVYPPYYCPPYPYTFPAQPATVFPSPPQPWECPRCHKMHGPMSLTCDCKPQAGRATGGIFSSIHDTPASGGPRDG